MHSIKNVFVFSLGGSLVVPDKIDAAYLKNFKKFAESRIKKGDKLIVVVGGGRTARNYRDAGAQVVRKMPVDDLDWLGIHATRLNAHLLRTIFRGEADIRIVTNPGLDPKSAKPIVIAAGNKPGNSTDLIAVELAKKYGATKVFNLSDVDYVYDRDPKEKGAKPIAKMTWREFRKLVGNKWDPGLHAPFDPIASKAAQAAKFEVIFLNGRNLKNLGNAMDNRAFSGTIISGE